MKNKSAKENSGLKELRRSALLVLMVPFIFIAFVWLVTYFFPIPNLQ